MKSYMKNARRAVITMSLFALCSLTANGALVTYLGGETNTGSGWLTDSVDKPAAFDPDGDNKYGFGKGNGYDVILRNASGTPNAWRRETSLPSFISASTLEAHVDSWATASPVGGYALADDPVGTTDNVGLWYRYMDVNVWRTYFSFTVSDTVSEETDFVVGILGSQGDPSSGMVGLELGRIYQTIGGASDSGEVTLIRSSDVDAQATGNRLSYNFFKIQSAVAGDTFMFTATRAAYNAAGFPATGNWGVTYEAIPEPATFGLIACSIGVAAVLRRRRRLA